MMVQTKTLIDFTKGLKFTESPRWHDGRLWFLDIHDKSINCCSEWSGVYRGRQDFLSEWDCDRT